MKDEQNRGDHRVHTYPRGGAHRGGPSGPGFHGPGPMGPGGPRGPHGPNAMNHGMPQERLNSLFHSRDIVG